MEQNKYDELEFESIEGTELKVSKGIQTEEGDTIRLVFTPGGISMLLSDKKTNIPDIIVDDPKVLDDGNMYAKKSFWQKVWSWIKKFFSGGGAPVGPSCRARGEIIWRTRKRRRFAPITSVAC